MNPWIVLYALVGLCVAIGYAIRMRNHFVDRFPGQDHDDVGDWGTYLFCGASCGLIWPLSATGFALAWTASRLARAVGRREGA